MENQQADINNDRMNRISRRDKSTGINAGYSKFVRIMRLALPLAAMIIVAILFLRTGIDDNLVVTTQNTDNKDIKEQQIVQNELLNPKFESMDKKNQPYEIIAKRAVQGEKNKDLIMLEQPIGTMIMKDGLKVIMKANTGAYRQDTERFFLQGSVFMEHEGGYTLRSEEAHIDLKQNFAWSEKHVQGSGHEISIDATGVKANGATGEIIFTGPAKLILENGIGGIK